MYINVPNHLLPECPECQGKGEKRVFKMYVGCFSVACSKCGGRGVIEPPRPYTCPFCNGKGEMPGVSEAWNHKLFPCDLCKGTGKIE
jgi:DnaJ-class molecular chaperone